MITLDGTNGITTPDLESAGPVTGSALTIGGSNISAANSLGFRNRIINGDMRIDQRNNGASVTIPTGASTYTVDRWQTNKDTAGITLTAQQSSTAPAGFKSSLLFTASVGGSPTSLQYLSFQQKIEGLNVSDLEFGTVNASAVTLSFWVRSSIAGTYAIALKNPANDRSYVATYTINTANTFEQKTITIAGDTTGTWLSTNGIGIRVGFDLGSGSGYNTTAGAWQAGDFFRTSGTVNWGGTIGATFYITGVQLEAGTVATPFERRDYGRELIMCQRYYESVYLSVNTYAAQWTGVEFFGVGVPFKTTKRVAPTIPNPTASGYWVTAAQNAYSAAGVHTFQAAYSSEFGFSLKSNRPAGNTTPTVANMYLWEGALTISASSEL